MKRRDVVGKILGLTSAGALLNAANLNANENPNKPNLDATAPSFGDHYPPVYDVKKFGAIADGVTDDGPAIQEAIDTCSKEGGGKVVLHNGVFLSGGIAFKNNVELHITSTATLLASPDIQKFNTDYKFNQPEPVRSFIHASGCHHIALTGNGTINGQGELFPSDGTYWVRPWLIQLRGCSDVRIENIFLTNSAVWACWLLQCKRVKVDGVRIENPVSPNRDGIDIDGCREVTVSNCNINTEDDSIAFKVSEKGYPCRDIVVTNCLLSSRCAAIRLGPDAIDNIENITISNCVIRNTKLNGIKIQESMGAVMRNVTFSNIVMENVRGPISIRVAGWQLKEDEPAPFEINDSNWENGKLQNILFDNIQATTPDDNICMSITGTSKTRPSGITFSNLDFTFTGGGTAQQGARRSVPDLDRHYPEMYIFGDLPAYALYVHHASDLVFHNVSFRLLSEDLRPAIVCDDVVGLELSSCRLAGSTKAESVVRLESCQNVLIANSRTLNTTGTFVRVEGNASNDIVLMSNKLNTVARLFEVTTGANRKAVKLIANY